MREVEVEAGAGAEGSAASAAASDEDRAVEVLGRWGIGGDEAQALVARHGAAAAGKAAAEARRLHAAGRLRSAAGFLRWAVAEQGETAVAAGPRSDSGSEFDLRSGSGGTAAAAAASSEAEGELVDDLDDAALAELAAAVVERHAARPAMVRLLTRVPPRQSKLMRAEVEALLRGT